MSFKQILMAGAALMVLTSPALATNDAPPPEDCPPGEGGQTLDAEVAQVSYGATAHQVLNLGQTGDAAGSAIAAGNLATAVADAVNLESEQRVKGPVVARSEAFIDHADGAVVLNAVAIGDGLTGAALDGPLNVEAVQSSGSGEVNAFADILAGSMENAAAIGSAGANTMQLTAENGALNADLSQEAEGPVRAWAGIDIATVEEVAFAQSTAAGNSIAAANAGGAMNVEVEQRHFGGETVALTDFFVERAGDAFGSANAAGNALTLANEGGPVTSYSNQVNTSWVQARSYVEIGEEVLGDAASIAAGVGNSAAVSSFGGSMDLTFHQGNYNATKAQATLIGDLYGDAAAQATAIGNSINATLCTYCSTGSMDAFASQYNSGPVYAGSFITSGASGNAFGAATAIGNTATFAIVPRTGGE